MATGTSTPNLPMAPRRRTAVVVAGMCGLAILAGLVGVTLLVGDLTTAANVAQLVSVVLAGSSSAVGLIAWGTRQPPPKTQPPRTPVQNQERAGAIASVLVLVALVASVFLGPKLLSTYVPDDAQGLVAAHVGDCVGSKAGADGFWVVPCWYRAATYRVVDVGLSRPWGQNNATRADALRFCQGSPGWDAMGRHVPAYPDNRTIVTVCLVHT